MWTDSKLSEIMAHSLKLPCEIIVAYFSVLLFDDSMMLPARYCMPKRVAIKQYKRGRISFQLSQSKEILVEVAECITINAARAPLHFLTFQGVG
jgi:hypothetical protein